MVTDFQVNRGMWEMFFFPRMKESCIHPTSELVYLLTF